MQERHRELVRGYRERLAKENRYIDFKGITPPFDPPPLEKFFIRPQPIQPEREVYQGVERPAPIDPEDALRKEGRFFIVGAPGSGKSTYLRYLAYKYARDPQAPIPILIRLREYARVLGTDSGRALRDFALENEAASGDKVLQRALQDAVKAKQVIWLLDGLDEARSWRYLVAEEITSLPGGLILTARPLEDKLSGLRDLSRLELEPFTRAKVDQFLRNWFSQLAESKGVGADWVDERMAALKVQLDQYPQIQSLIRDPLLLTILVILVGEEPLPELPSQRAKFFQRYVKKLVNEWEMKRYPRAGTDGKPSFTLGECSGDNAMEAALDGFSYLGWYLHLADCERHGEKEPHNQKGKLITTLKRCYQKNPEWNNLSGGKAKSLAKDVLEFWEKAGVLEERTIDKESYYAFRHMGFQEYAVADVLALCWSQDPKHTWEKTVRHILHHYAWHEPLLLFPGILEKKSGILPKEQSKKQEDYRGPLIRRLLRGPSLLERYLHRDLRLAAAFLAEGEAVDARPVINRLDKVIRSPRRALWTSLIMYLLGAITLYLTVSVWWVVGTGLLVWTAAWLVAFVIPVCPRIQTLLALPWFIWDYTPESKPFLYALGKIKDPEATERLGQFLKTGEMDIRFSAVTALGEIGGPQAGKLLVQVLGDDRDMVVRAGAAWALGKIGTPQAMEPLCQALKDRDRIVREASASALGMIGTPQAVELLRHALNDRNEDVRGAAASALGKIGTPQAVEPLRQALKDRGKIVREVAASALGEIGTPQAVELLSQALEDGNWEMNWSAVRALEKIGTSQAMERLNQALENRDQFVQRAIAEALEEIDTPRAAGPLVQPLGDRDESVSGVSAETLGKIDTPEALELLRQALSDDSKSYVRQRTAEALGKIGTPEAVELLSPYLNHVLCNSPVTRGAATRALEKIGTPDAVELLARTLGDTYGMVRLAAAEALRNIGTPEAADRLGQVVANGDPEMRLQAFKLLREIGAPEALEPLGQIVVNGKWGMRQAAGGALKEIGTAEAWERYNQALAERKMKWWRPAARAPEEVGTAEAMEPLVQSLVDNKVVWVRHAAALALGEIGTPQAVEFLSEALGSCDWFARWAAAEVLAKLGTPRTVELLSHALGGGGKVVRRAAAMALERIGTPQAMERLGHAMGDGDMTVSLAAAGALVKLGTPQAIEHLSQGLENRDKEVRRAAAEALERIGTSQALAHLRQARDDSDKQVRLAAVSAWSDTGAQETMEQLKQALRDSGKEVRRKAAYDLGKIGKPVAMEPLIRSLRDSSRDVRLYSIFGLAKILETILDSKLDTRLAQRAARALRYRLTDIAVDVEFPLFSDTVSRAAFQALEKIANRLTALDVASHPIPDPLEYSAGNGGRNWPQVAIQVIPVVLGIILEKLIYEMNKFWGVAWLTEGPARIVLLVMGVIAMYGLLSFVLKKL